MSNRITRIQREGFAGYRDYVNAAVSLRAELLGEPVKVLHTQDGRLVEGDREIEDFHGTQSFGHRHPAITAAVKEFLDSDSPNWYPSRVNPYAGSLAERLCARANRTNEGPRPAYNNVFFANSGSGAVEAALKLGRAATRRPGILSIEGAYHGCTMGSCALMSDGMFREPFAPHLPGVEALPFGDVDALARAIRGGGVAAVVVEPIQLEGGVRPLSAAYLEALCELTGQHDVVLVADEIQTGLGRTGRFVASESWPRRPDALLLGKHLGGGLLPISAMLTRTELFDRAYGAHFATAEAHNSTFSGNAMVCVAAHATLDLLTDEVIARVAAVGERFRGRLTGTLARHPLFAGICGAGLLVGLSLVPIDHPWLSFEHFGVTGLADKPAVGVLLANRLYRRGFYCFVCGHEWQVLRILPRFNIPETTLDAFVQVLDDELEYLCGLA